MFTDELEFKLGFYSQYDYLDREGMGIAIRAYKDNEPYAIITVNVPNALGICETISIKNCAYVDTNNFPFVTELIEKGIAVDTGFKRHSGFCEYPLYQFDEEWLKSLQPISSQYSYLDYENKFKELFDEDYGDEPELSDEIDKWLDDYDEAVESHSIDNDDAISFLIHASYLLRKARDEM